MMDLKHASQKILPHDRKVVAGQGWLAGRSAEFRAAMMKKASVRHFLEDEAFYHIGDRADGLFSVVSGSVKITIPSDDGQEFVAHRAGVGFWIGDLAMLSDAKRLVSVVATSPVRTLFFPSVWIEKMVAVNPRFYRDFYSLSHKSTETTLRILANLAVQQSDHRLALRLLHLNETPDHPDGWIKLSQEDLAALIAVSLPTLQRLLRGFSDKGLVELGYGKIRIRDRLALIALCQN